MTYAEMKITGNKERAEKLNRIHTTTVEGQKYNFWSDDILVGTYAENESGEIKRLTGGTYIHKDLTVRKAIASRYGHKTFRK